MSIVLPEAKDHSSPYVLPYLTLGFEKGGIWEIEVDGKVGLYLAGYDETRKAYNEVVEKIGIVSAVKLRLPPCLGQPYNWLSRATPELDGLIDKLRVLKGSPVEYAGFYNSSAAPSHILRGEMLFTGRHLTSDAYKSVGRFKFTDIAPFIPRIYDVRAVLFT